jgi:hypothetical protein
MNAALESLVWDRARQCCEYCQLPQSAIPLPHQIDHIIAQKHDGPTIASNLALACFACNNHKGPNLSGIDPASGKMVRLYHPRRHKWARHFRWNRPVLEGRTPIGRTTIAVLCINLPHRVALRRSLIDDALFPPVG